MGCRHAKSLTVPAVSNSQEPVVRVKNRQHPFKYWLVNVRPKRTHESVAAALGISKYYLSAVLAGSKTPSRELYGDMARLSRGAVTLAELEAFKKPSARPRRLKPRPHRLTDVTNAAPEPGKVIPLRRRAKGGGK
jgi:hypothetical protein